MSTITPNIYKWPIKLSHEFHHRRMFDNFLECAHEFNDFVKENDIGIPRLDSGDVDYENVTVDFLLKWFMMNAQRTSHIHPET